MKLELTSTKINSVINRKELSFRIEENKTPSRSEVRREIAVIMRTQPENVYIRNLISKSGTRMTLGLAHVYEDSKMALKVEPTHIIIRNDGKPQTKNNDEKKEEKTN
jgi:ribosomal protein S24E